MNHACSFVLLKYKKGCTRLAAASDKVYQLLAHGRWFSPGTPASSTTKTGRHDIAEILLKVALKHQKSKSNQINSTSINMTLSTIFIECHSVRMAVQSKISLNTSPSVLLLPGMLKHGSSPKFILTILLFSHVHVCRCTCKQGYLVLSFI